MPRDFGILHCARQNSRADLIECRPQDGAPDVGAFQLLTRDGEVSSALEKAFNSRMHRYQGGWVAGFSTGCDGTQHAARKHLGV